MRTFIHHSTQKKQSLYYTISVSLYVTRKLRVPSSPRSRGDKHMSIRSNLPSGFRSMVSESSRKFLEQLTSAVLQLLLQNQEVPFDLLEIGKLP